MVAFRASGSPTGVASRLAFPACWVQGNHSTTSVGLLSFPSGNSLSPLYLNRGRVGRLWCVTHAVHTLQSHCLVGSLWCVPASGNWLRPLLVFRCYVVDVLWGLRPRHPSALPRGVGRPRLCVYSDCPKPLLPAPFGARTYVGLLVHRRAPVGVCRLPLLWRSSPFVGGQYPCSTAFGAHRPCARPC